MANLCCPNTAAASSSACFPSSFVRCSMNGTSTNVICIPRSNGLRPLKEGVFSRSSHQDLSSLLHANIHRAVCASQRSTGIRGQVTMMPIGTPKVPYRTPTEGGWQWVDIWNVLYRERIIFIGQFIDEEFSNQLIATMLYLDSLDTSKPMYLYLNSPGGDVTPSMALYDTMESIKSPVGTVAVGYAYNNAGFLLAAGSKGSRLAMPLTRISLQSPSGAARGRADDIQNEARELNRIRNYLFEQLAIKTGQPLEKITKDLSRIKRFNSQEALEYGIIDRIIRPQRVKPDASPKPEAGVGIG